MARSAGFSVGWRGLSAFSNVVMVRLQDRDPLHNYLINNDEFIIL
jgi:hypothetical protein